MKSKSVRLQTRQISSGYHFQPILLGKIPSKTVLRSRN